MIDDAPESLAELLTFGNVWHGSCDATAGFRTRAGVAMPYVTKRVSMPSSVFYGSTINWRTSAGVSDAHLIDFGRPSLTTPDEDAAAGKHWWNKTILFGDVKSYSVLANGDGFGPSGWPYKASDGRTWFLDARYIDDRTLGVYAKPLVLKSTLADTFIVPTVLVASISLPTDSSGYPLAGDVFANFDPTSGEHAAIHSWCAGGMWIVEATLIGGTSSDSAPTVSLSLTRFRKWLNHPWVSGYVDESDVSVSYGKGTALTADDGSPWYNIDLPTSPAGFFSTDLSYWDANAYSSVTWRCAWNELLAIGYGADGSRIPLTFNVSRSIDCTCATPAFTTPGSLSMSVSYSLASGASSRSHSISGSATIEDVFHRFDMLLHRLSVSSSDVPVSSGQTLTVSLPGIFRVGANAFALLRADAGTPSGQRMLEIWAGHGFSGHYTSPQLMSDSQPRLAIDPVTGAFSPTTWYYF